MKKLIAFVIAFSLLFPALFVFGDDENLPSDQEVIDLLQSDPPEEIFEDEVPEEFDEVMEDLPEEEIQEDVVEGEVMEEELPEESNPVEDEILEEEVNEELPLNILIHEILPDPELDEAENEFIELFNAGDSLVDLAGWVLDDSNLEDDQFYTFDNPDVNYQLEPGAYLALFRPETGITLNNDQDAVYLFDGSMQEMDSFVFEEVLTGASWGRSFEDVEQWQLFPTPSPGEENIFSNQTPVAQIELQSGTKNMTVNVTGESSVDPDGDDLEFIWVFEDGVTISKANPAGYTYSTPGLKIIQLTVIDPFGAEHQATFEFEAKEEIVEPLPDSNDDNSGGSGGGSTPDPVEDFESEDYPTLNLIHEILPNPVGSDAEGEWVELSNDSGKAVDLSSWYLDDADGASSPFQIPEGTILESGGYVVFQNPELNLSLKNDSDVVRLLNPDKIESEVIDYSEAVEGWSYSKVELGDWQWTPELTPGEKNSFPPPPKTYTPGDVVFDSALPNPEGPDAGKEKIRLKNRTSEVIDLSYWMLADLKSEVVLLDHSIEPGELLTLTSEDFGLNLNNTDETLTLLDPAGNEIDSMSWETSTESVWLFNTSSFFDGMEVQVMEVVDGDTFKIEWVDREFTVRLLGVDTPETVHPSKSVEYFGQEASNHLKSLLEGRTARLEFDERKMDTYGRLLAYVFLNDQLVNAEVIQNGFGLAYTRFEFDRQSEFEALEAEAREAGRGLWADESVASVVESEQEEDDTEEVSVEMGDEAEESVDESEGEEDDSDLEVPNEVLDCDSDQLKLYAIFPSPEKGKEEYIELINPGEVPVCLAGWQLDDEVEGGSKPFTFEEGQLEAGELKRFEKTVTKLSLNNSNDCATLIRPNGEVADQICYEKTKKDEVFTHEGGSSGSSDAAKSSDSKSTKKSSTSSDAGSTQKHSFARESSEYRVDLVNASFAGLIVGMDEEEGVLVVQMEDESLLPVSYKDSLFEVDTVKKLLNLKEKVTFDVYKTAEQVHLISMRSPSLQSQDPVGWGWLWLLGVPISGFGLLVYQKFRLPF